MDKRECGFTLVELVIAVAISGLIVSFLSQVVIMAVQAYGINLENSDAMTRITPVLKRIETEVIESPYLKSTTNSPITGVIPAVTGRTTFTSVTVQTIDSAGSDTIHHFFWDGNGSGSADIGDSSGGATDNSKAVYRISGSATDVLFSSKGTIPAGALAVKYGTDWDYSYIRIKDFYFSFYKEGSTPGTTVLWASGDGYEKIRYMEIHVEMEGAVQQSSFNFNTGFKLK